MKDEFKFISKSLNHFNLYLNFFNLLIQDKPQNIDVILALTILLQNIW